MNAEESPAGVPPRLGRLLSDLAREEALAREDGLSRYRIEDAIGEGGMGVVHRAFDVRLQRPVALKLLKPGSRRSAGLVREARAAARVVHPHVVTVYDAGVDGDRSFIAMELVEGTTLRRLLESESRDLVALVRLLEEAARGVAAAHASGVIHRDLTPANVLVDRQGRAKVVDFGLASPREEGPIAGGTPCYMAPEQVRPGADDRADVFGLGAILYHVLRGAPPPRGGTRAELEQDPEPPPGPPELVDLARRALSRRPADRPPGAEAFAGELAAWLARSPRRRPAFRRSAWLAAVLLAGFAAWAVRDRLRPPAASPPPARIEVVSAQWGRDGRFEDVTGAVRELVDRRAVVRADRDRLGAGDPVPGRDKNLIFLLDVAGRKVRFHLAQGGGNVDFAPDDPLSSTPDGPIHVAWAKWGRDGDFEDVTTSVRERVGQDSVLRADRDHLAAGDPAPGRDKNLIVLFAFDGAPVRLHLARGGGNVRFGDDDPAGEE